MFGGGYDTNQDTAVAAGADTLGHAIYMVDPLTGARLWWASSSGSPTLTLSKMTFSIPADLTLIDTDGDGSIDRIYGVDMGGQVWRIDLGKLLKTDTNGAGTAGYVFADVGCTGGLPATDRPTCAATTEQNRRKFFYPP